MEWIMKNGLDMPQQLRPLFEEYTTMLVEEEPAFRAYLGQQKYDAELEHPECKYGPPWGRLYLACVEKDVVGCVALRKIDDENCELKRLYMRPAYRRMGIGRKLVEQILADAREIGYRYALLDTFLFLKTAIAMYKSMGFYEIESYNGSPVEELVYLKFDL